MPSKKTVLKLERDLKRRAKKMRLGKKRTGAYVYGTLRKLRSPGISQTLWVVVKGGETINDSAYDRRIFAEKMAKAHRARVMTLKQYEDMRRLRGNPVRTKTWKLGEYGGNIKVNVNESRTAVQIVHSDKPLRPGAYGRLFRWPMDRFNLEVYLNELTTSYYASKILDWVSASTGVGRGLQNTTQYEVADLEEPRGIIRGRNVIRRNGLTRQRLVDEKGNQYFPGTQEAKIRALRKIVETRTNAKVGNYRVDLYSASAIVSVYDQLRPDNQEKFLKLPIPKMADLAFRIIHTRDVNKNPGKRGSIIASNDWNGVQRILVFRKNFRPVYIGQKLISFRGTPAVAMGGSAPHNVSSEGRVFVREGRLEYSYYPSVFNLYWLVATKFHERGDR